MPNFKFLRRREVPQEFRRHTYIFLAFHQGILLEGGRTLVFGVRVRFAFAYGTVRVRFGFACLTVRVRFGFA